LLFGFLGMPIFICKIKIDEIQNGTVKVFPENFSQLRSTPKIEKKRGHIRCKFLIWQSKPELFLPIKAMQGTWSRYAEKI